MNNPFPRDFVWGAAASSFQIEGACAEDGRGDSIWDVFCREPGRVLGGHTGEPACDHYHRYREDLALMAGLGIRAWRFSVAWPRVVPDGDGAVEPRGLDFYDRLVDACLELGIEPWVTLYHWDLPQALEERGGWRRPQVVPAFARYAGIVADRLRDRVRHFITLNEPWCSSMLGYMSGEHAPGIRSWPAALAASHHLLLAHHAAVRRLREVAPTASVGITLNLNPAVPVSPSAADAAAARRFDGFFNRWFLDPVVGRGFPEDMVHEYDALGRLRREAGGWSADGVAVDAGAHREEAAPIDFLGVNYYNRTLIRCERTPEEENLPRTVHPEPPEQWTDMPWEVHPPSLADLLCRLHDELPGLPLYITENGAAYGDGPDAQGRVHDRARVEYHRRHLLACADALREGVDLRGYFAWSLLDNFEWAFGYERRFGLVWVDFDSQERVIKESGRWYGEVCRSGGEAINTDG